MENVIQFYENYDEDGRLFRDKAHLPEYLTTVYYFDRLFTPGSRILDVCAGTGRYSFYLADKGHHVTACDIVEHYVNIIKSKPNADKLTDIAVCNALDLSRFEENGFDAVLCMGALYHLSSNDLKEKAISECMRVCKSGGIIALAYVVGGLNKALDDSYEGVFFCSTPREIEEIAVKCGLKRLHNIGTDGMAYNNAAKLNGASDEDFRKHMERHYSTCEDEGVVEASGHALWIGRKN
ncbi:MAG: class I SAM-dependent methyltransferase [Defluviitaleaceae bacterium]|nr:class I SAM-dependent methyltransferase [Defluviitaleaceae bacterium]MCL2835614.1 class I SAM-dependent methyltransferase [Defluviitaleaceae bacterium]